MLAKPLNQNWNNFKKNDFFEFNGQRQVSLYIYKIILEDIYIIYPAGEY